ncbi:MAG TPA: FAD-binding oxidoreductase [Candidatus Acidoferrales bacterium]|nr:FAD-binding oxidoreductase [Candidatus Acidoferrales bacterium]
MSERRWNGWGDPRVCAELPRGALAYLRERLGVPALPRDADLASVTAAVPPSRLPVHAGLDASAEARVRHARGQSLADWFALRFGRIGCFPDAVAFPSTGEEFRGLIEFARQTGAALVPYGGGTSVAGHLAPVGSSPETPVVAVSTSRRCGLLELDRASRLATFGAGTPGPRIEAALNGAGYTLGHFPQSFEYSTLGGWIVTRSSGQQSLYYGRIEALFAGGTVETPIGTLRIPTVPASAAGPDLREAVLGSEGRIGFVTDAVVRVRPLPEEESFHGIFFRAWPEAFATARELSQSGIPLSMVRLSNAAETLTAMRLAGGGTAKRLQQGYLSMRGAREAACLLILGITGTKASARTAFESARRIWRRGGGIDAGPRIGDRWKRQRFAGVYLRNALWERGYAVDTFETAVDWPRVEATVASMESAARAAFGREPVHAYTHLSHVYPQGSSVYSTVIFPILADYDANVARWSRLKRNVSEAIVASGGTISHQHGVGLDHKPYLEAEKGPLGIGLLRAAFAYFDPDGIMNPGKLV